MKLLWDFFGPDAERTAVHFEQHLTQFLTSNGHAELTRGTESAGAGHQAAFCIVPEALVDPMKRALRPNRVVPDVPPEPAASSTVDQRDER